MQKPQRLRLALPLVLAAPQILLAPSARAQQPWPSAPIRLVVPFPPGGSSDILGRLVAEHLARRLNANIFVDNKPGGTTQIGTELVANAHPDGHTLLLAAASSFTTLPNLRKLTYSLDSFEIIGGVADYIAVMAVRKTLPIENVKQFVDYAKQNPGKLAFGSAGEASAGHVYGLTLARDTGIQVLHVPFKGSAAAVNALVAGEIDFIIDGAITPMVKADRVRPLATLYRRRHPDLPQVPTLSEAGFDITSTQASGWGLVAPKGTPAAILSRLSGALHQVLEQKDVQDAFARANSIASWQTPEALRKGLESDLRVYAELLPAIGIK
ncbi:tripartite tricarboxylate transporter substrate binding protein [Ottowia sp.]|uniref:Bug family tripartite tricarboxylate transporter substrate binding protein n=1 Tax=Ottowia sp. TaxID=1898956 RepID=UPI0025DA4592|nr:tripartite tricarboxylate transporter substrate binding protein [Ottowia sp.]MBK6745325.1 tripartite tricarboxylate transporter substrate binding protein [Ottowia sp.]